jgi:hypothetical protein
MHSLLVHTNLGSAGEVRLVGAAPSLGAWSVDAAPALPQLRDSGGSFAGDFGGPLQADYAGAGADADGCEYKLAARVSPSAPWRWLPGPNRRLPAPSSAPSSAAPPPPHEVFWPAACDGTDVIAQDGYLEPHRAHLAARFALFTETLARIEAQPGEAAAAAAAAAAAWACWLALFRRYSRSSPLALAHSRAGGLDDFSRGWEKFGLTRVDGEEPAGLHFREWAPAARAASLVGDFNHWNADANPCAKDQFVRARASPAAPARALPAIHLPAATQRPFRAPRRPARRACSTASCPTPPTARPPCRTTPITSCRWCWRRASA